MTTPKTTLLIVEDDARTASAVCDCAQSLGYDVLRTISSGEEAVSLARELKPELVLMDIQLAGSMDGIDASARIRELKIPVVFLTASSDADTVDRAKLTEPFGFITKPLRARDLHIAVEIGLYKHKVELERDRLTEELRQALTEVKTLSGLLPICAYCKKIKDGAGYWSQVEAYIMKHSDASFTHGMCPECFDRVKKEIDSLETSATPDDSKLAGH